MVNNIESMRASKGRVFRRIEEALFEGSFDDLADLRVSRQATRQLVARGAGDAILRYLGPTFELPDREIWLGAHWSLTEQASASGIAPMLLVYAWQAGTTTSFNVTPSFDEVAARTIAACADGQTYERWYQPAA